MNWKKAWKKTWHFIWESDSVWSWIVNIILAFVLIKFIVYPGLGFAMQTTYPIVAVVSGSMEHKTTLVCIEFNKKTNECAVYNKNIFMICGKTFNKKQDSNFDTFWDICGPWYEENTKITKEDFSKFTLKNGFNKGDIMVLRGIKPEKIKTGDTIVYMSRTASYPIIHRIVEVKQSENRYTFITKGDHNGGSDAPVDESQIIGKAILKIPFLGWIKIGFVKLINMLVGL